MTKKTTNQLLEEILAELRSLNKSTVIDQQGGTTYKRSQCPNCGNYFPNGATHQCMSTLKYF